ncbi:FMN-binding protein [Niallia sp. Krafla_26]|uniref:FMN-binding protein n=1 Tax=Niallia sp. Krafla_26 TaxID=3064703 RepID=UPI003D1645B1
MKRLIALLFTILVAFIVTTGCSSEESNAEAEASKEPVVYEDGTYEGTSDTGRNPGLKVTVVITDRKIAEVNVIDHDETDGFGTKAIESLPGKMVEAQSTKVDTISGATQTSKAIVEAVRAALSQAN